MSRPWRSVNAGLYAIVWTFVLSASVGTAGRFDAELYPWPVAENSRPLIQAVAPPNGYRRVPVEPGSFADWLRHLPVKHGRPPIHNYDGRPSSFQMHHAVIDIDVGGNDLQQCADAAIRLRAEYLFAAGFADEICFRFTSGHPVAWRDWRVGLRPVVNRRNEVRFEKLQPEDSSYANFRRYLNSIFTYCGSASLARDSEPVDMPHLASGDLFVRGGYPGGSELSPWYILESSETRFIAPPYPEFFTPHNLKRLRRDCGLADGE